MKLVLGKSGGKSATLDLNVLLRTRLLIQANSGGGKSWLIRRLAEQTFGKVPTIIIDPEGEFASLREKFGFVLVGKGGETPADPRSAEIVARKLLELGASAICDLYEMKRTERHHWVRLFLENLVDAPKSLWRPALVIVDEAHQFCPEKGCGESEAADSMIDLATRGRKRGFCAGWATQRLSKLRKDATAELLNRFIGPTFEDLDLDRAADTLSISRSERPVFFQEMKTLEPGHFYALGRAISKNRIMVRVGMVVTTHPEPGSAKYSAAPPPPPSKLKALLPKLAELPKQAEEEAKTTIELRRKVRELEIQLRRSPRQVVQQPEVKHKIERVEIAVLKDPQIKRLEKFVGKLADIAGGMSSIVVDIRTALEKIQNNHHPITLPARPQHSPPAPPPRHGTQNVGRALPTPTPTADRRLLAGAPDDVGQLRAGEKKMLEVLASSYPTKRTRAQLGTLAGFTPSGGTYANYFGTLKRLGFISVTGDDVEITRTGFDYLGSDAPLPPQTTEEILTMWRSALRAGERAMLDVLVDIYPEWMTREELGERTRFTASGGTFANYLGTLARNGLVEKQGDTVRASETLYKFEAVDGGRRQ